MTEQTLINKCQSCSTPEAQSSTEPIFPGLLATLVLTGRLVTKSWLWSHPREAPSPTLLPLNVFCHPPRKRPPTMNRTISQVIQFATLHVYNSSYLVFLHCKLGKFSFHFLKQILIFPLLDSLSQRKFPTVILKEIQLIDTQGTYYWPTKYYIIYIFIFLL